MSQDEPSRQLFAVERPANTILIYFIIRAIGNRLPPAPPRDHAALVPGNLDQHMLRLIKLIFELFPTLPSDFEIFLGGDSAVNNLCSRSSPAAFGSSLNGLKNERV